MENLRIGKGTPARNWRPSARLFHAPDLPVFVAIGPLPGSNSFFVAVTISSVFRRHQMDAGLKPPNPYCYSDGAIWNLPFGANAICVFPRLQPLEARGGG
jgi:hypothetical protein